MKRLVGVLTAISFLFATIWIAAAKAQEAGKATSGTTDPAISDMPATNTPATGTVTTDAALDTPTATSAAALAGFENRDARLDYELLFLPEGTGGERNRPEAWTGYLQDDLAPIAETLGGNLNGRPVAIAVPAYANAEETQIFTPVDQRRLTISAPLSDTVK